MPEQSACITEELIIIILFFSGTMWADHIAEVSARSG